MLATAAVLVLVYLATFSLAQATGIGELGAPPVAARVLSVGPTGTEVLVDRQVRVVTALLEADRDGNVVVYDHGTQLLLTPDDGPPAVFAAVCTLVAAVAAAGCCMYRTVPSGRPAPRRA